MVSNEVLLEYQAQFPFLNQSIDKPIVYLDSAATTQKPKCVIDALNQHLLNFTANVHRGGHRLGREATAQFEAARIAVQGFINAKHAHEIIWTSGTTESINQLANILSGQIQPGDTIVTSILEHHANFVPWQQMAQRQNANFCVVPLDESQTTVCMKSFRQMLEKQPKIVALSHVSNALGTIHEIKTLCQLAKNAGAFVIVDGAQAIGHLPIDVQALGCDFYTFSGHKMYAPDGIGVLYGREDLLEALPPWQFGGEMVKRVSVEETTFNQLPYKFEAGTPNISAVIGLHTAIDFLTQFDQSQRLTHEQQLLHAMYDGLLEIDGICLLSPRENNVGVLSFTVEDEHHADIAMMLDQFDIAVRAGHHCAMPLMGALGTSGSTRASIGLYNTKEDIDYFIQSLNKTIRLLTV
ncbi:aminotransferase class V-fold PLP-dependent enzyme [Algicola sagamiensis]|uniref:aminotransferase class V-fold PLP-dependent enzyme n=1 Tax=Algicola sagamiensis TaxID=163869 RepID=UPI00037633AF|nr:cysteine desulfurase [Algicola sagamiensis]